MKKLFAIIFLCLLAITTTNAQTKKKEVFLLGTFHFHNPGADLVKVKSMDILSEQRQKEIREVVENIKKFKPDVIFIEWEPSRQGRVDSLFAVYKKNNGKTERKDEDHQVVFPVARELGNVEIICVDDQTTDFPFDSVMLVAKRAGQTANMAKFEADMKKMGDDNNARQAKMSIGELLLYCNGDAYRDEDLNFYHQDIPVIGGLDNSVGAHLTSEWYRRNLIIYSQILNRVTDKHQPIMVMFGASHVDLLRDFFKYNHQFETVDTPKILRGQ